MRSYLSLGEVWGQTLVSSPRINGGLGCWHTILCFSRYQGPDWNSPGTPDALLRSRANERGTYANVAASLGSTTRLLLHLGVVVILW